MTDMPAHTFSSKSVLMLTTHTAWAGAEMLLLLLAALSTGLFLCPGLGVVQSMCGVWLLWPSN